METLADSRSRFLDATAKLLQVHGYEGTSLNRIIAESRAPRGSLYHYFPGGKDELVREATLRSIASVDAFLRECFGPHRDPVEAVRRYAREAARELAESDFVFGCPVAPLVLDGLERQELARICRRALEGWQDTVATRLQAEGLAPVQARSFATVVVATIEGALLMARAFRDPGPLMRAAEELAAQTDGLLREKGRSE